MPWSVHSRSISTIFVKPFLQAICSGARWILSRALTSISGYANKNLVITPIVKDVRIYVPRELHAQVTHSITEERLQVVKSLDTWAEKTLFPYLKPVEKCWQPQDHLPDSSSKGFYDELKELRARAAEFPEDYLVLLVGDMITEEALPTYQTMLNTLDGTKDETGASLTPWGVWTRAWTAEENRHGDLLNKYLYLTGHVNMRSIEKTIQYLVGSGMVSKV